MAEASNDNISQKLIQRRSILEQSTPIELYYNVKIDAKVKKQIKPILYTQQGLIPQKSFTAILGPSGSGKTTLLNFLSGRLMSNNLIIQGQYKMNGKSIKSVEPYSNQIGYVMQQDALLAPLTPRQCLRFAADFKLSQSRQKKESIIDDLLQQLGLVQCQHTKIGNNFIKGISGGQRKRTSIGVQLITNPGIIFLDQPTTGLDSTTALQVILLLKDLAQKGKTVISTIHQPSSQLFYEFDRLMLLVDGKCIFHGPALQAQGHFASMGHKCPKLMNASEYYLDLMSLHNDQVDQDKYKVQKLAHDEKINKFQECYLKSEFSKFQSNTQLFPIQVQPSRSVSIFYQLYLIFMRTLICILRNPMDVGFKIIQSVFTAIIVIIVYGEIDNNILQNVQGVIFFLVASNAFGGIQGTLATFSTQRPVFLRQRFSKTYSTFVYFIARTGCNFPFDIIYPSIGVTIVYWATGLGHEQMHQFLKLVCVANTTYFLAASYGLFYAAIIPKLQTAMALVPALIIPFMLLGGFFIDLDQYHDIRVIFYPIMYLSPFKYGYQGGILSVRDNLQKKFIPETYQQNILVLVGMGIILRLIASVAMQFISNPKRPKIKGNNSLHKSSSSSKKSQKSQQRINQSGKKMVQQ